MAKAGPGPRMGDAAVEDGTGSRSRLTREQIVEAARATLVEVGFAQTSARAIAARAGVSQAAVFYQFGSVPDVLLAVLDAVSERRRAAYSALVADAGTLTELVNSARSMYAADLASGDVRVLVELIAGSRTVPGMSEAVAERLAPWQELAATSLRSVAPPMASALVDIEGVARAIVAGFLGLELLAMLDGDGDGDGDGAGAGAGSRGLALFDQAAGMARLLDSFGAGPPGAATPGATTLGVVRP
jgi:AcrR family transcriptional regulator